VHGYLRYATPGVVDEHGERARFDLLAGGIAVCVNAFGRRTLVATACPTLAAGLLWGTGRRSEVIRSVQTDNELWAAGGLTGRLEVALNESLYLDAQAGGLVCLVCPSFYYRYDREPALSMSEAPALSLAAGLGFGAWLE
jgi:hypothetical protein